MFEIAKELGMSEHKIAYWMSKYEIKTRSRSEALYLKLNPLGDPFEIKIIQSNSDFLLMGLGIGIYWGEGNKVTRNSVRVTNSDPNMILIFREFLLKICQVTPEKIRYSLICFNDSNKNDVVRHWSELLEEPEAKFGKIVEIPTQGKGTYRKKSKYGICTITVSNLKLKQWIMNQVQNQARLVQR